MNYRQENKFAMYQRVQQLGRTATADWPTLPAAIAAFAAFETCLQRIRQAVQLQEKPMTGLTLDKAEARIALIDQAFVVSRALLTYARQTNKQALAHLIGQPRSDWDRYRDRRVHTKAEQVLETAGALAEILRPYGIRAADLDQLKSLLEAYAGKTGDASIAIVRRQEATQNIKTQMQAADLLLHDLDRLFVQAADSAFYQRYKIARKIVNRRSRRAVARARAGK